MSERQETAAGNDRPWLNRSTATQDERSLSRTQAVMIGLGSLVVVAAMVLVLRPELAVGLGFGHILKLAMAATAVVVGVGYARSYLDGGHTAANPPLVEYRSTISIPGSDIDAQLLESETLNAWTSYKRMRPVRNRLRKLLTGALLDSGSSNAEADEIILEGSWTDDPIAGSFLSKDERFEGAERSRNLFERTPNIQRTVREIIDDIAERFAVKDRVWTDIDDPGNISIIQEGWLGGLGDVTTRDRETNRWRIVGAMTLIAVGIGVVSQSPSILLAGAVGTGLIGYQYIGTAPSPDLVVERAVDKPTPNPGDEVTVTVTVTNAGDGMLFDCRLIDGVPPALGVVDGSPRHGTTLRPGAKTRFAYVVEVDRGEHAFEEPLVIARDASGSVERTTTVEAEGETAIRCEPNPNRDLTVPVRAKTSQEVGRVVTDIGGSGLEFHSVREYRTGDPLKRIDWNRAARGQDLATLQFREEHAATVVMLIDARAQAFVAPGPEEDSAVERSLEAAATVFLSRLDSDDRVGLAGLSAGECWLAPGTGHGHWPLARELLTTNSAFTEANEDEEFSPIHATRELRKKLPKNAQLVLFSPLCDDEAVYLARRLHAYGYSMTVVSPDTTTTDSPGRTVAHIERELRLSRLRQSDVRVIDWNRDEPLETATDRATRRWSR